jgi:hypothetical protein
MHQKYNLYLEAIKWKLLNGMLMIL